MPDVLVSIVIPVYNGEEWLQRCVDSARNQTYSNLEIIVVDDGSKDGSGTIWDRLALSDSRIKVIHQKNGGVNSARWKGVDIADGKELPGAELALYDVDIEDENFEPTLEKPLSLPASLPPG